MTQPVTLDEPMYAFPMDDKGLAIVGRITLMWGHIDSKIDQIIDHIHKFKPGQFEVFLKTATIGTKVDILNRSLPYIARDDARAKVVEAVAAMRPLLPERNDVAHGQWGWHVDLKTCVVTPACRRDERQFLGADLPRLHNQIAAASHTVDQAFRLIWNRPDAADLTGVTNRPYTFGEGLPTKEQLAKLRGQYWPPPRGAPPIQD